MAGKRLSDFLRIIGQSDEDRRLAEKLAYDEAQKTPDMQRSLIERGTVWPVSPLADVVGGLPQDQVAEMGFNPVAAAARALIAKATGGTSALGTLVTNPGSMPGAFTQDNQRYSPIKSWQDIINEQNIKNKQLDLQNKMDEMRISQAEQEARQAGEVTTALRGGKELFPGMKTKSTKVGKTTFESKGTDTEYKNDLNNAIEAVNKGGNAQKIYQRIAAAYPEKSAELQRILIPKGSSNNMEQLFQ